MTNLPPLPPSLPYLLLESLEKRVKVEELVARALSLSLASTLSSSVKADCTGPSDVKQTISSSKDTSLSDFLSSVRSLSFLVWESASEPSPFLLLHIKGGGSALIERRIISSSLSLPTPDRSPRDPLVLWLHWISPPPLPPPSPPLILI